MADWVWVESPGTALEEAPRLRTSQFGDGYQQRALDGINALAQSWSLAFTDVDDPVATDMIAFLRTNAGQPFSYWPLWGDAAVKVTCDTWHRTLGSALYTSSISATFVRWYGP